MSERMQALKWQTKIATIERYESSALLGLCVYALLLEFLVPGEAGSCVRVCARADHGWLIFFLRRQRRLGMDELQESSKKLSLTEQEQYSVVDDDLEAGEERCLTKVYLVCQLFSARPFNATTLVTTLRIVLYLNSRAERMQIGSWRGDHGFSIISMSSCW